MYAESTSKITFLFNILTGSLGQAEVVVMNHREGKKATDPQKSGWKMKKWFLSEEMVPKGGLHQPV